MNKIKLQIFSAAFILSFLLAGYTEAQNMPQPLQDKISKPWTFQYNFKDALYKADFSAFNREITGLFFVKKEDSIFHFVLLSELGMKYYDAQISAEGGLITTNYVVDFLNYNKILSEIENLLKMLVKSFPDIKKEFTSDNSEPLNTINVIKSEGKTYSYHYFLQSGIVFAIYQNGLLNNKTSIVMDNYNLNCPGSVKYSSPKVSFNLIRIEK